MWPFSKKNKAEPAKDEFQMLDSFESGNYTTDVVGESHYQGNLDKICGGKTEDGHRLKVKAVMFCDDTNKHDNNAVRIDIDGLTVGHLSRTDAIAHRKILVDQNLPKMPVRCSALIGGGWSRDGGEDTGSYGVKLDVFNMQGN